jgi:hypothetical protein
MGGGLAGRCPRLKVTGEGATANHLQEMKTVIPAKAGIQYAAAYRFNHCCLWDTGSPAFAGDDD